jgi:hypothetical protein
VYFGAELLIVLIFISFFYFFLFSFYLACPTTKQAQLVLQRSSQRPSWILPRPPPPVSCYGLAYLRPCAHALTHTRTCGHAWQVAANDLPRCKNRLAALEGALRDPPPKISLSSSCMAYIRLRTFGPPRAYGPRGLGMSARGDESQPLPC